MFVFIASFPMFVTTVSTLVYVYTISGRKFARIFNFKDCLWYSELVFSASYFSKFVVTLLNN